MIIYMFPSLNEVIKGLFGWRGGKMEGWKIFNFPSCVFGWRDGKIFCLVGRKNEMMEIEIRINLQLCPY